MMKPSAQVSANARNAALFVPLLLVNGIGVFGQASWAYEHLVAIWIVAALFAIAVESIGFYLAIEAHAALMAGDASAGLRNGSYLIGALAGGLNYWHFAGPGYRPTPLAITFGLLSAISPWLWAIRSRSMNRDRLRTLGLVDPRAVRFSKLRWALFPARTFLAFRSAVWAGRVMPAEAIAAADEERAIRRTKLITPTTVEKITTATVAITATDQPAIEAVPSTLRPEGGESAFTSVAEAERIVTQALANLMLSAAKPVQPEPVVEVETFNLQVSTAKPVRSRTRARTHLGHGRRLRPSTGRRRTASAPEAVSAMADIPAAEPEPVPAEAPVKRRPPVPNHRIVAALRNSEAVPRRRDGTVAIRDVERRWGCRQERAVKLLKEAGVHRAGEGEPVPAT